MSDETVRAPKHVLLEETLTAIFDALRARPRTALSRELLREAERYQRVVDGWGTRAAPDAQRAAMFDCVLELRWRVAQGDSLTATPGNPPSAAHTAGRKAAR